MSTYTYDGCCGSCQYLNTNNYTGHKDHCYCTCRRQYYNLTEPKCSSYKYDPNKNYYELNRRWYIVSAIFDKLGLSTDYECISLLHRFRMNVLDKDERYTSTLAEYDIIGPKIADLLSNDTDSAVLCKRLLQVFLVQVLDRIREGNMDKALSLYIEMVNFLKTIYEVDLKEREGYQEDKEKIA